MNIRQSNTAILFFSRSARFEDQFKSLLDSSLNRSLIKSLKSNTLSEIKKTNLPFYVFDERKQKGSDFGQRIANAFEELFALGYENVISVGNDCPELKASDISDSASQLKNHDLVIGPDLRGGAYLIGISKEVFDHRQFEKLAWQTDQLVESLVDSIVSAKVSFLAVRFDLNTKADLVEFGSKSSVLALMLQLIFNLDHQTTKLLPLGKSTLLKYSNKRRGPPIAA